MSFRQSEQLQRGSSLLVAIVLLLILTVAVFAAMPMLLGEQRISGNDLRAKLAHHIAEAGLGHGREFLRLNATTLLPTPLATTNAALWTSCGTDSSFPCGAVEAAQRAETYRYRAGADGRTVDFPNGKLYDGTGLDAGNFDGQYDVGILLCRVTATSTCTRIASNAPGTVVFTIVSRGQVNGEQTTATVTETVGTYKLVNAPPNVPPLMAAGAIAGIGSSTIVANDNSGGFGVPLSMWTKNDFDGSGGSWQTCRLDEYLRSSLTDVKMVGADHDIPICLNCDCVAGKQTSSSTASVGEGIDILDSSDTDSGKAKPGSPYYFPCDIFRYIFSVQSRSDNNTDGFCETLIGTSPNSNVELWLGVNAKPGTCSTLNQNSRGLIWIKESCAPGGGGSLGGIIGSPDNPVALVIDGNVKFDTSAEIYGIVYLRYGGADATGCVSGGTGCPEFLTGGGTAKIFGAVIIEGGGSINANIDLVYVPKILMNLTMAPENFRFGALPGSWSDRVTY
ncbi:MAG: PilX N-terminal domain-containing pilus assembly protein [Steroidobacteraceae bacterium]